MHQQVKSTIVCCVTYTNYVTYNEKYKLDKTKMMTFVTFHREC
jgi:hypothetical protein